MIKLQAGQAINLFSKESRPALGPTGRLRYERWLFFARPGSQDPLEASLRMCGAITPNSHTLSRLLRPMLYRECHRTGRKTLDVECNIQTEMCDIQLFYVCGSGHFRKRCASFTRNFRTAQSLESCSLGCQADPHSHSNQRNNTIRDLHFETNLLVYLQEPLTLPHYLHSSRLWEGKQSLLTSFWVCQIAIFFTFRYVALFL